jgi:hypothetical protein
VLTCKARCCEKCVVIRKNVSDRVASMAAVASLKDGRMVNGRDEMMKRFAIDPENTRTE